MKINKILLLFVLFLITSCVGTSSTGVFGTGVSIALDPRTIGTQIDDSIMQKNLSAKLINMNTSSDFLGHPKGLFVCFATEMWERFSYYGMRALLILYLTKHWEFSDATSYLIYGAYTSLVYIMPVFGGMLADQILGSKNAVTYGAILLVFCHLGMTV